MQLLEGKYEVEEEEEREDDGFHSDSENVDYLLLTTKCHKDGVIPDLVSSPLW